MLLQMPETLLDEYRRRKGQADLEYARLRMAARPLQWAIGVAGLLALTLLVDAIRGQGSFWPFAGTLLAAIAMGVVLRLRFDTRHAWRRSMFYERAIARASGEEPNAGLTGDAFAREGHLYQYDLNVLGKDSLFDRLATTRTVLGQRGLARLLLDPVSADEARRRQTAVRELVGRLDIRERIGLTGRFRFEDVPADGFELWLDAEHGGFAGWLRGALAAVTLTWIVVGALGLALHVNGQMLAMSVGALFVIQGALCQRVKTRVLDELEAARPLETQLSLLRQGLHVLRESRFGAPKLIELQKAAEGEDRALAHLERLLMIVDQRPKEWFYLLSLAFGIGTHTPIALEGWKRTYAARLRRWLEAWSEFEALAALGTYAAEHEECVWPEILNPQREGKAFFVAQAIRHPLLRRDVAVPNDLDVDGERRYLLISGSNMAGKSTLLRALGANAVLALAGAPVAAESLRMNVVRLGASIAVSDSLSDGKSRFLAEVERLKGIVTTAREHSGGVLFLIDEILAGTNSADRKTAAKSVVHSLLDAGAVGAISTHDLALAEIAAATDSGGENVHMASRNAEDPLAFDYRLKPGVNRITNAIAIVRMMGLECQIAGTVADN